MHMKYFQQIAGIGEHYDTVQREYERVTTGRNFLLESWGVSEEDIGDMAEEKEVLRYLVGSQLGFVRDKRVAKPTVELVERTFNRHLDFLKNIHGIHKYNVNKHECKITMKEYKACRHYLFKFSLPGWDRKMPEEILTLEEKREINKTKRLG